MSKAYVSYVIQSEELHCHDFELVELPRNQIAIYKDTAGEEVYKWSVGKQRTLKAQEKLVVISFFTIE